ncbi:restriction endonuclease [Streptomyces sp. NPDC086766]|uniref:restriction endonuclease n=1 Tax=Streptomyces sp. NPDC086766 TaxID=3365754 RepID=UPI0037FF493B
MARLVCPLCGQQVVATRQGLPRHQRAGGGQCLPDGRTGVSIPAVGCSAVVVAIVAGVIFTSWTVFGVFSLIALAVVVVMANTPAARLAAADRRAIAAVERDATTRGVAKPPVRDIEQDAKQLLQELPPLGSTVEDAVAACMKRLRPWDPLPLTVQFTKLARAHVAADERILALTVQEADTLRGAPLLAIITDKALVVKDKGIVYRDDDPEVHTGEHGYLASGARYFTFSNNHVLRVAVEARRLAASSRRKATVPERRPTERLIREARDAELIAVEWMRYFGFDDAAATPVGADGGIDVVSARAVAQVKMEGKPTGRPIVQQLHGVAVHEGKTGVFFSLAGYTPQARTWAQTSGTLLFRFDYQGAIEPVNAAAHELLAAADTRLP